jgi:hypothetical protein
VPDVTLIKRKFVQSAFALEGVTQAVLEELPGQAGLV